MTMLVLTRKPGEKIVIGGNITLVVCELEGNKVRLAIEAPRDVRILRGELIDLKTAKTAAKPDASDRDLIAKPAEWRDVAPDLVISPR
jgi:carbon storage regulator